MHRRADRDRAGDHQRDDRARARATSAVAPGNRPLTLQRAGEPARAAALVRRQDSPLNQAMQRKRAADTARWMDTAMRPDPYPAPVQRKGAGDTTGPALPSDGGGHRMPLPLQAKMEGAFGVDLSAVRIHEGPRAPALGARAYTQGTNVHFAPGEYRPESHSGQELLGHELAHVVQQSRGRVQATTQRKGVGVNDSAALEAEADAMGARAARGERVGGGGSAAGLAATTAGAGVQLSKLSADQGQVAIQRAALAADKLNVVGEQHDESRDRRPNEAALLREETGATGYWLEGEFRVDMAGVHHGDRSVDTQQADPSLGRVRHVLADFASRLSSAFTAYEDTVEPWRDEELDAMARGESAKNRQKLHAAATQMYLQINDTVLQELHEHFHYLEREGASATKIAPVARIIELTVQLKSMAWFSGELDDVEAVGNLLAWIKGKGVGLVAQCREARWISDGDQASMFDEPDAIMDDARSQRSRGMHDVATRNAGVLGMWKIGDLHVTDIQALLDTDVVQGPDYQLLTRAEFNEIYDKRYGGVDE